MRNPGPRERSRKLIACALVLLPLAVAAIAWPACNQSQSCTLIGCVDQVTVNVPPQVSFPYDVTLTLDGKSASFTCDSTGVRSAVGVTIEQCDATGFRVVGEPTTLSVSIPCGLGPDDGGVLHCSGTFTPQYTIAQPNGPSCEPTCHQATVTLQ